MHFKTTSKRTIQKTAEATGDLIANKHVGVSKTSQENSSKTVTTENDK